MYDTCSLYVLPLPLLLLLLLPPPPPPPPGHVMINRVDRRSQLKCLQQCRDLLAEGAPVLFFPEGEGGGKEGRELQG